MLFFRCSSNIPEKKMYHSFHRNIINIDIEKKPFFSSKSAY